jgi:flagellar hook-associated protein 1
MSLSTALNAAVTGLAVNQRGLEIASHNIGNAHTDGYSRKVIQQEAISTSSFGSGGVQVANVQRVADEFLVNQVRTESATFGKAETRDRYFGNLQDMFGTISSNSSIGQQMADLSSRMESLAVEPESPTSALALIDTALTLTRDMNDMSKRIVDLRHDADVEISQVVDQVNIDLQRVVKLNQDIANASNLGIDAGDLRDSRDLALKRVGQAINIKTFERDTGEVVVVTGDAKILVDGDAATIDYEASSTGQIGTTFQTLSIDGQSIQSDVRDGKLKGLLEVRDKVLPNLHSELDALAAKTRDVINLAHNRGMGFPAANSLSGTRQFADTATETVTLDVDVRVATTSNNGIIQGHFDLPAGAYTLDDMATALNDGFVAAGLPDGPIATASIGISGLTITAANAAHGIGIADLNGGTDATIAL